MAPAAPAAPKPAAVGAVAPIDRILAIVDGSPIWWSAYTQELALVPNVPDAARADLEKATLEHMIDDALIRSRAKLLHVEVDDAEIDEAFKLVMAQNNLDAAGLTTALVQVGMTVPLYREALRQQILDVKTFRIWLMGQPPIEQTPDKVAAAHDQWIARLRRGGRIEKR